MKKLWNDISTCPRDGSWFVAEGEFEGGDTSSVRVVRWCPQTFETGTYELQAVNTDFRLLDMTVSPEDAIEAYPIDRAFGWLYLGDLT